MKNKVQTGLTITVIAPTNVRSGQAVLVGTLFGVAAFDAVQGAQVEIERAGVFDLPAASADTASQGAKVYWDNTALRVTTTAASNALIGALTGAKAAGYTIARVLLDAAIRP